MFQKCFLACLVVLLAVMLIYGLSHLETGDEAGAWIPSPVGSGMCVAQGIPHVFNGTLASCPRP